MEPQPCCFPNGALACSCRVQANGKLDASKIGTLALDRPIPSIRSVATIVVVYGPCKLVARNLSNPFPNTVMALWISYIVRPVTSVPKDVGHHEGQKVKIPE